METLPACIWWKHKDFCLPRKAQRGMRSCRMIHGWINQPLPFCPFVLLRCSLLCHLGTMYCVTRNCLLGTDKSITMEREGGRVPGHITPRWYPTLLWHMYLGLSTEMWLCRDLGLWWWGYSTKTQPLRPCKVPGPKAAVLQGAGLLPARASESQIVSNTSEKAISKFFSNTF